MYENPEIAFGDASRLLGLIDLIYSSAQQPELWSAVMEQIAEAIHGESTTLFASFPQEPLFAMARTEPAAWDAYSGYYASVNPLAQGCDEMFTDGEVRYAHHAVSNSELTKTEFYNDFFTRYNMHYSIGLKVPLDNLPAAYLSCQRPYSQGPFEEREGLVYQTLLPHLQRALSLHLQMTQMQSHVQGLEAALESFGHAVLGLDGDGKVTLTSREAEALVRANDGIRVSNERLTARNAAEKARLQAAISDAVTLPFATATAHASILIRRQSNPAPLQITVVPYRSSLPGRAALAALVFIGDPARRSPSKAALLRAMYNLSPTEARVADLLGEGLTVREVAGQLNAALETARFHTKKILAKTGVRRQAELMRLMVALPNV